MKTISLPDPPNPSDQNFQQDPKSYNLAMYRWASNLKSQLQLSSRLNDRAVAQSFTVGAFTTASTLTGTDSTTNVAQVLCTLINAMLQKGILKTTIINQ